MPLRRFTDEIVKNTCVFNDFKRPTSKHTVFLAIFVWGRKGPLGPKKKGPQKGPQNGPQKGTKKGPNVDPKMTQQYRKGVKAREFSSMTPQQVAKTRDLCIRKSTIIYG